jgi:hypothetical protein
MATTSLPLQRRGPTHTLHPAAPTPSSPYTQQPHPRAPLHPTQETSWRIHRSGPREHSEGREHEPSGAKFRVVGLVLTLLSLVAGQLCHAALVPQCLGRRACTAHITGECAALRALPLGDGEERDENLTVGLVLWGFLDLCPFTVAHYLRPCLPWRTTFDPVYRGALPSTLFTVAHYLRPCLPWRTTLLIRVKQVIARCVSTLSWSSYRTGLFVTFVTQGLVYHDPAHLSNKNVCAVPHGTPSLCHVGKGSKNPRFSPCRRCGKGHRQSAMRSGFLTAERQGAVPR